MMLRGLCAVALIIAFPVAASAKGASPCSTKTNSVLYFPGDAGFFEAIDMHNGMASRVSTDAFQRKDAPSWKIGSADTAYIKVTAQATNCGVARESLKFDCQFVGCNEGIPGTEEYSPGDTLTTNSCSSTTYVKTTTTWTKQPNGSWTVTTRNSEQHTSCDPE